MFLLAHISNEAADSLENKPERRLLVQILVKELEGCGLMLCDFD